MSLAGGSLGVRSPSNGSSLDKEQQHQELNGSGGGSPQSRNKPAKMIKEKERILLLFYKFAARQKVGMLLLCVISAAAFVWVLYVEEGGNMQDNNRVSSIRITGNSSLSYADNKTSTLYGSQYTALSPPPIEYFHGYTLPVGHRCNSFTLPPPPADPKRTGPRPCPVCYLSVEQAISLMPKLPSYSPVIKSLTYIHEDPVKKGGEFGGSDFGGYPTLSQRNDSYDVRESMSMHCGFVRGEKPGADTGFDMIESDRDAMEQCNGIVVASAIFGAFDDIQQPTNISEYSRETVCFFMFVDEETEVYLKNSSGLDSSRKIGIWKIVVVHNLPYTDGRRNGKIPKLLVHRLFPNARFSLWIDGKLQLVVDPYQILERHLWRKNATFAISKHYRRFDVFVEAEANKVAGKYDNASIDFQIDLYRKEGLTPYSTAKLPITSDVPEGCVILREHVPISNLFTCLWFNEVDRFTSRDQLSFAIVRDKIRAKTNWTVNMFLDCERRNFVEQKYHRDVLEYMAIPPPINPPPQLLLPPPVLIYEPPNKREPEDSSGSAGGQKHGWRSGSKDHRKIVAGSKDSDQS